MKNSPIIKVKDSRGDQININAMHVISFVHNGQELTVQMSNGTEFDVDCTERSFRSYMNKAYGVSKNTEEA